MIHDNLVKHLAII